MLSIIGAVVGEYLGGATGLGYLLVASMNNYKVGMLFAVIILLTVIGFVLYLLIGVLRRLVIPWHKVGTDQRTGGDGVRADENIHSARRWHKFCFAVPVG